MNSLSEVSEVVKGLAISHTQNKTIQNGLRKAQKLLTEGKVYADGTVGSQSRPITHQVIFAGMPKKYDCTCEATVFEASLGKICCHCLAQHVAHLAAIELPPCPPAPLHPCPPAPQPTVWDIFASRIEGEDLNLWGGQEEVIWQSPSGATTVAVHCNKARQLLLVARNGKVTTSKALAINSPAAAAWDWRLTDNAHTKYQLWAEQVSSNRPAWHFRPAITELMDRHGIAHDTAFEMYQEKV